LGLSGTRDGRRANGTCSFYLLAPEAHLGAGAWTVGIRKMLLLAGGSKAYGGVKGERSKDDLSMTLPIIPKNKRVMAAVLPVLGASICFTVQHTPSIAHARRKHM
jgi:hypothetical protein